MGVDSSTSRTQGDRHTTTASVSCALLGREEALRGDAVWMSHVKLRWTMDWPADQFPSFLSGRKERGLTPSSSSSILRLVIHKLIHPLTLIRPAIHEEIHSLVQRWSCSVVARYKQRPWGCSKVHHRFLHQYFGFKDPVVFVDCC